MEFFPVEMNNELNLRFIDNPECLLIIEIFQSHYKKSGFVKPWIAYFAANDKGEMIGGGAYKGQPKDGKVEISYGTFKDFQGQGVATEICGQLVSLALQAEPSLKIIARTLPENSASIKVLERNGFTSAGIVHDDEDGNVLEWIKQELTFNRRTAA